MAKIAVISLSGGMDSTGLLVHLLAKDYDVKALSFNYGQKHSIELERAKKNIEYLDNNNYRVEHKIIDLQSAMSVFNSALTDSNIEVPRGHYEQDNMKQTVVPNRNAIFSALVYGYALSIATETKQEVKMSLGVHSGDHEIYPDCREVFFKALFNSFSIGNWGSELVKIYLPFLSGDKFTILYDSLQSCQALAIDFDTIFANTNTSYAPTEEGLSDGTTGADIERILAFHRLGRKDPVQYIKPWEEVLKNALQIEKEFINE